MVELQHSSSSERSLLQRADGHTNWDEVWRRERGRGSEYQVATTPGAPKEDERSIGVWERAIFAGVGAEDHAWDHAEDRGATDGRSGVSA